ncbi:unnamed protein product [Penicillium olsonii]|uniref:DUF676 domain-containing protein n=1 Tax=Penicillium olsonii TaxID=99116 RepID=A0A9W4HMH6_PENOL|nr:unnamed protein product [Penicillium olsonii]CAG8287261.1 unnamed protein product [Penicillium olsonii]
MAYGYDVDVFRFSETSSDRLYDCGQSMGYSIVSQRINCSTRPILFIAHGLGGLICQQTLIISNTIDGLWQISSSSIGIIFMGTPHYGSIASYVDKLAKCMDTGHSMDRGTVDAFYPGSNDLQRVGNEFQLMLHRDDLSLRIFCFYEAFEMNGEVGKIVEEHSAVLRGHDSCSVDTNHANMTRFRGRADGCYRLIQSIIAKWLQDPANESKKASASFGAGSKPCPPWLQPLDTEPFATPEYTESGSELSAWSTAPTPTERPLITETTHFYRFINTGNLMQR